MNDGVKEFTQNLENATRKFKSDPRQGVSETLQAVLQYIEYLNLPVDLTPPIHALQFALRDTERGVEHPLLEVRKLDNRPPIAIDEKLARAQAAAALELFIMAGMSSNEAAQIVYQHAKKWSWRGTTNVTANAIKKWRENARAGLDSEDWDATTFNELIKFADKNSEGYEITARRFLNDPPWMA